MVRSLAALEPDSTQVVRAEAAALGGASSRVLVGGCSQGAGAALHCVATYVCSNSELELIFLSFSN